MSGQLQLRRGTTAQNSTFTGAVGELTYNTDDGSLISHDGVTAGGYSGGGNLYAPGAVVTSVQAKLQEIVSVKDFGAVGDGVADDTAAINAAVASAVAFNGGTILFPNGRYLVTSTIQINAPSIYLIGQGETVSYIVNGSSNTPAVSYGDNVTLRYSGGVSNLGFTGKLGVIGVVGQIGLKVSKFGQMNFENLRFDASGSSLHIGVSLISLSQTIFAKVNSQACISSGIDILGAIDLYMDSCRSDANGGSGYVLNACQGMQVANCTAYGNTQQGWYLSSGDPLNAPNKNNFFNSCVGDTSGSFNWLITDSKDSMFTNCWGSTQISATVNTFATGFYIQSQYCKDLLFTGCIAEYNNSHGFSLDCTTSAPSKISFVNCMFGGTGHGNGRSGSGSGIRINGGANVITGIRIAGGLFSDNATSPINNSSTGDVKITGIPVGYINEQKGVVNPSSGTSIAVTFPQQLISSPLTILITPWWNSGVVWASNITSSGFTINWTNVAASSVFFSWSASV